MLHRLGRQYDPPSLHLSLSMEWVDQSWISWLPVKLLMFDFQVSPGYLSPKISCLHFKHLMPSSDFATFWMNQRPITDFERMFLYGSQMLFIQTFSCSMGTACPVWVPSLKCWACADRVDWWCYWFHKLYALVIANPFNDYFDLFLNTSSSLQTIYAINSENANNSQDYIN